MVLGSWQPSVPDLDGIYIGVLYMLSYVHAVVHNGKVMQHRLYFSTLVSDKGLRKFPDQNSAASCPVISNFSVFLDCEDLPFLLCIGCLFFAGMVHNDVW